MKSIDSQGRNLLTTGKIALAGTLLLAGPALANQDRTSFKEFRQANPGMDRQELRQQFRADRQIEIQQIRDARHTTGGGGPRVEHTPIQNNQFVIQPIVTPTAPRLENRTTYLTDNGRTRNVSKGLKLDLTSDNRAIVLGENLFAGQSSYTVNVGGEQKVLTSGSRVTAAEFVALQQVIDGDSQSLVVDQSGRGVDGSFNLASIDNAGRNIKASSLTISEGVDVVGNFGRNSDFKVTRELVNYGNMYALTTNAANNKANIGARDVTNAGTITTQAPEALAAANGAVDAAIDLKVSADRDLSNTGTISSNGTVTLSAGGSVLNGGSVSAASHVNLISSNVVNSGSVESAGGSINFDTVGAGNIAVENNGGTFSALNGAINFRQAGFAGKNDTTVSGGDWLSQTLNIHSGDGHVKVAAQDISGLVNTYAGVATIKADNDSLNIGETVTSGDPLFENAGDLNLVANVTSGGGPITAIAGGNINIGNGVTFDSTGAGDGGDILFIAGAAHVGTGPLTVTGASGTGGSVNFTGTAPVFNASSATANGGDITVAAFAGSGGGTVNLGGATTITSTGASGFDNGTVSILANSITVGAVDVNGAGTTNTAGTGNIVLSAGQPVIVGTLAIDANGNVTSGSLTPGTATLSTSVSATGSLNAKNLVSVSANSTNVSGASVTSGSYSVTSGGTININNGINVTGSVSLLTTQNIDIRNSVIAPGGILMVAGEDISVITPPIGMTISTSAPGQGGDITMVAGATFTQTATTVTITGAANSSDNASINLTFGTTLVDTRGTGLDANGGNITLATFASINRSDSGSINTDGSGFVRTGGTNNGDNGNFIAVSGRNDGFNGISLANGVNTSGAADNGTGDVTLRTAAPQTGVVLSKINGGVASGTFLGGASANSGITSGSGSTIQTNGGDVEIISGRINSNNAIDLGTVTTQSGRIRLNAIGATSDMQLRTMQGGSIVVTSTQDVVLRGPDGWNTISQLGAGILVVAGRNIQNIDDGSELLTEVGAGGQSGSISLIAGASFTEDATTITISGPTASGGSIDLTQVDTVSTAGITGASAGQLNLIAYRGTGGTGGFVSTSGNLVLSTAGSGAGFNGNVTVMGGAGGGTAINVGGVWDTSGGVSGTGSVLIESFQPINGAVLSKSSGAVTSVGFSNGAVIAPSGVNLINGGFNLTADAESTVTINSGAGLNMTNTSVSAGDIRISSVGDIAGVNDLTTSGNGSVVVTSEGFLNLRGDITAPGGVVLVAGGAVNTPAANCSIDTSNATGPGGDVTIVSGATFTQDLVNVTITGSSNQDSIGINLTNTFNGIDTRGLAANSSGGDINLFRMSSTGNFTGGISLGSTGSLLTGGNGSGSNGNITVRGAHTGNNLAISIDAPIDTTGGASGTGDVILQTAAPTNGVIRKSDAGITSGLTAGAITDARIFQSNGTAGITMDGGDLILESGRSIQMQGVTNLGGEVSYSAGVTGDATANIKGIQADSISVVTSGEIDMRGGDMIAQNGILFVAGGNISNNAGAMSISTAHALDAGNITLIAGANFSQGSGSVTINGASATGGNISLGNSFSQLDARSTAGVGDGGDITLVAYAANDGSQGIVFDDNAAGQFRAGGSGAGANGDILIIGSNNQGGNGINLQNSITVSGGANGTGSVTLRTVSPGTTVTLSRLTASETAGSFVTTSTQNSTVRVANNIIADGGDVDVLSGRDVSINSIDITPSAIGDAGSISIQTTGTSTLQIGAGGTNSVSAVSFNGGLVSGDGGSFTAINNGTAGIQVNGSVLQMNNNVGAGGSILLDADQGVLSFANGPVVIEASGEGGTPQDGGSITLRAASFNLNGLNVDLRTNQSLGGGNAGSITIESDSSLTNIIGSGANQFEIQQTGPNGSLSLTSQLGSIALNNPITVDNLTLNAATGITQTSGAIIDVSNLSLNLTSGTANLGSAANVIDILTATGGGSVVLTNGSNNIQISGLGATQSLDLTTLGEVTLANNITTTGDVLVSTTSLVAQANLTANSINVSSPTSLLVDGDSVNSNFQATGAGQIITFTANNGDLSLSGTQTYITEAEMNVLASGSTFRVLALADIEGLQTLTVNSVLTQLVGSIVGNPLIFNNLDGAGVIANSTGDVTLTGSTIINGNFSIIASGNVNIGTATVINLNGGLTAPGGDLVILAGFDFTPATAGQVGPPGNNAVTYTGFTANATGGNINMNGLIVNTSSGISNGGDVLLVANGGTTNSGSISIGDIDASGSVTGGNVTVIAEGQITTGNITSTGTTGGTISLQVASPTVVGTPQILKGVLKNGSFGAGAVGISNITTGNLSAGNGTVFLRTAGAGSVSVQDVSAHDISLLAEGSGNLAINAGDQAITSIVDGSGNGGSIFLTSGSLVTNSANGNPLAVVAAGTTGDGGQVVIDTDEQSNTYIGNVPKAKGVNFVSVDVSSGAAGNAGRVDIEVGGNLYIDTATGLDIATGTNGDGASVEFKAGTSAPKGGSVVIIGNLDATGNGTGEGGSIDIATASSKAFSVGGTKTPKNGVQGQLLTGADGSISLFNNGGGVAFAASNAVSTETLEVEVTGKGTITTGKDVTITANEISLLADSGAIGKKVFSFSAGLISARTAGSVNLNSVGAGLLAVDFSRGSSFVLTTAGSVNLNDIETDKGEISVTAATGVLTINDNSTLTANNGALNLINSDINAGSINLGADTVIETQGKGKDVNIAIGVPPKKPTNTTPPAGVVDIDTGKGESYFSAAAGFTVIGANETRGTNKNVIINNGSAAPGTQKIIFGGNVVVEADPPSRGGAAPVLMPSLMSPSAVENNALANTGSLNLTTGSVSQNSIIGAGFNSLNIAALPTDLLNSVSNTANAEINLAGVSVASQQPGSVSTAYDYMTDAYVWSDEDLGLGAASMLKSGSAKAGTESADAFSGGIRGGSNVEVAKLRQGTLVLAPSQDTRLETPMGTIEVSKGSVALVVLDGTRLGVYDLHDEHKGSVRVSSGSKATTLSPGRCTVLTTNVQHGFERVNPMESVGYKSVAAVHHGNGVKAFNAEFATMHAIGSVKPLMDIVGSKHDNARRMSNKLMKTSAVLMHLSNNGEFKVYAEPSVTAMTR
jgi:hypothetical protein